MAQERRSERGTFLGQIELDEAAIEATLPSRPGDLLLEDRTCKRIGVILAVFAAGIDAGRGDVGREALVDDATEPGRVELCQVDAGDHRSAAGRDVFLKQEMRRLAPDRLYMLQPGRGDPVFVPGAHISQVNIPENNARESRIAECR